MADNEQEKIAHRWHMEIVQEGKLDLADQLLTRDVVVHVGGQDFRGLDAVKQTAQALHASLPDVKFTHHEALANGDKAAIRWSLSGTHRGNYFGVPASGNTINSSGIDWFHFTGNQISEIWIDYDNASVLQQMGALPQR